MGFSLAAPGTVHVCRKATLVAALCCMSVASRIAWAESVEFLGAQFPVRGVSAVEHGQVVVEVDGGKWMSATDKVGFSVADFYAKHPHLGREMPWDAYVQFLARDVAQENSVLAPEALENSLRSEKLFDHELDQLFTAVGAVPDKGEDAILQSILAVSSKGDAKPQSVCRAVARLDEQGCQKLKAERASYLSTIQDRCRELLVATVRESISTGSFAAADSAIQAFRGVFSGGGAFTSLYASQERLRALADADRGGDVARVNAALQMLATDPNFGQKVEESLPLFVRGIAEKKLGGADPQGALVALTLLPLTRRTPAHHEILLKALEGVSSADVKVFSDVNVQRMVWGYASQDPLIKVRYLSLLDSMVATIAARGDYVTGIHLLAAIREVRPDPSVDNDRLRLDLSKAALRSGDKEVALSIAAGIVTGTPLFFRAYLWARTNLSTVVTIMVLGIGLIALRQRSGGKVAAQGEDSEEDAFVDEETLREEFLADRREALHRFSQTTKLKASEREFFQLLAVFDLQGEPSTHDIKNAYRHAVKECHPDLNRGGDGKANDRFIELTKQYERLLELHEQRAKTS